MLCSITIAPALGQSRLVIEDVTLIDGTDGPPRHNVEVTVEGDRITRIAPVQHAVKLTGATVVDGRNKYLIPGLWNNDLHAFDYAHAKAALPSLLSYAFNSMAQALVQMHAPDDMRGRVIGVFSMSAMGMRTFSGLSVGLLGASVGIHDSLALSAAVLFAVIATMFIARWFRSPEKKEG